MSLLSNTIESLQRLIAFPSVSCTSNAEVSDCISEQMRSLGFQVEQTDYVDFQGVRKVNVLACRRPASAQGSSSGGLAYFCHTDVVPAVGWTGPGGDPFVGVIDEDRLFGRGSCDMKGSLAAFVAAASQVDPATQKAPLWIVCTADEEVGFEGAKHLVKESEGYREIVDSQPLAIIGEPTRLSVVHAHKGIVGARVTSRGRAAHSSTTDGVNANEAMVPILQTLLEIARQCREDSRYHDHRFDPPSLSWNFGVSDHCDAVNITPEQSVAWLSLRPMPGIDGEDLLERVRHHAETLGLHFQRFAGGGPLWIEPDEPGIQAMCELAGGPPKTVCYGTDGGEFMELQQRVVFGPGDIAQAHTTDEWIHFEQLQRGIELYTRAIQRWCCEEELT